MSKEKQDLAKLSIQNHDTSNDVQIVNQPTQIGCDGCQLKNRSPKSNMENNLNINGNVSQQKSTAKCELETCEGDASENELFKQEAPMFSDYKLCGLVVLTLSIIGGSSIGTFANFITATNSFQKNAWRSGILVLFFIIPATIEYYYLENQRKTKGLLDESSKKAVSHKNLFDFKAYQFIILTILMQVIWVQGLVYASLNSIQSHAYIFNNIHGIFIVLINSIIGKVTPHKYESLGVVFALVGGAMMVFDQNASRADGKQSNIILVDILDILSAVFGALYFIMSVKNLKTLPTCFLILIFNFHTFLINSIFAKLSSKIGSSDGDVSEQVVIFSFDPEYGCLGFLSGENILMNLVLYGSLSSICGSAGYILCLLFYTPVVTTNAYLLEPFIAQLLGYFTGLDNLPGTMTWIGTVITVFCIYMIDQGGRKRIQEVQDKKKQKIQTKKEELTSLKQNQASQLLQNQNPINSKFNTQNIDGELNYFQIKEDDDNEKNGEFFSSNLGPDEKSNVNQYKTALISKNQ